MTLLLPLMAVVLGQAEAAPEQAPTNEELLQRIQVLEQRLNQSDESAKLRGSRVTVSGYLDVGFFLPQGNGGSGVVLDVASQAFPQYRDQYAWVFLGDLYAPAVNTRGEPADLGDLPGVSRFDSVHSRGAPGFLVN